MVFQCVPIMQINTGLPLEDHWAIASASVIPVVSQCTEISRLEVISSDYFPSCNPLCIQLVWRELFALSRFHLYYNDAHIQGMLSDVEVLTIYMYWRAVDSSVGCNSKSFSSGIPVWGNFSSSVPVYPVSIRWVAQLYPSVHWVDQWHFSVHLTSRCTLA